MRERCNYRCLVCVIEHLAVTDRTGVTLDATVLLQSKQTGIIGLTNIFLLLPIYSLTDLRKKKLFSQAKKQILFQ